MGTRSLALTIPVGLTALAAAGAPAAVVPLDPARLAHGRAFAAAQLTATAGSLSSSQFPTVTAANGQWTTRSASDWRAGFFPGQLWQTYETSGSTLWRDRAVNWTDPLTPSAVTQDHDIGFVTMSSWGHALRLGATRAYRDEARSNILANAQVLSNRFKPAMGLIDSWINLEEPNGVCIDNMMNLELLFAAHTQGGGQGGEILRDVGIAHAQTTLQRFVRADGGTYHVVRHEDDGSIERKSTRQGYGDETTWSRGQAWAIHGFATTYAYTRDATFLTAGQRTADYFIANLPHNLNAATSPANVQAGDFVPPSDFHAERGEPAGAWNDADNDGNPGETNSGNRPGTPAGSTPYVNDRLLALNTYTQRDSSAAAVAASGLFRLATLVPTDTPANQALRQTYFGAARDILNSLLTHHDANTKLNYLADGVSGTGGGAGPLRSILARGSELWNGASVGTSYGDYYFLEALARYEQAGLDFLPLSVGNQWTGGSGNWSDAPRWTAGAPATGAARMAHFRALGGATATTVTLDAPRTIGGLTFNSIRRYVIAGPAMLRIEGLGEGQIDVEASPALGHEIAAPLELASDVGVTVAPGAAMRLSGSLAGGAARLTKLGDGRLTLAGPQQWSAGAIIRVAAGEMELAGNAAAAGPNLQLIADGGVTTISGTQSLAALTINGRATVAAAPGAAVSGATWIKTNSLAIGSQAELDLSDGGLIVRSAAVGTWSGSNYTALAGLIDTGRGNAASPAWDGFGIVTSDPRASSGNDLVTIGVAKLGTLRGISDSASETFAGQTLLGSDTIAMVTWGGDANLDGKINIQDYGQIDFNVLTSGANGWFNGDFNYDGKINILDYGIIDFNVIAQDGSFAIGPIAATPRVARPPDGSNVVPEPASTALFAIAFVLIPGTARRRRRYGSLNFRPAPATTG